MLWLGKPRTPEQDRSWVERYLSNAIGRGITPHQWEEIHKADREFNARKPSWSSPCLVCDHRHGWVEAQDEDGRRWVCAQCHRPQLPEAEALAEKGRLQDEAAKEAAQKAADAAAAATPAATRERLRIAVQRHQEAEAALARLQAGTTKLNEAYYDARRALEVAQAELAKAQKSAPDELIAAAIGDGPATPKKTVADAERDVADAERRLAEARAASTRIEELVAQAKTSIGYRRTNVRDAALETIAANSAGSIRQYITETARLQRELADRLHAFDWLKKADILPLDEATKLVSTQFIDNDVRKWQRPETSTVAKWEAVVTALSSDPKARAQIG